MEVAEVGGGRVHLVEAAVGVPQVGLGDHLVHSFVAAAGSDVIIG